MPSKRRGLRRPQFDIAHQESQVAADRARSLFGSAKVNIDVLTFDNDLADQADETNVRRLLQVFQEAGCQRLDSRYHVPATIAGEDLDRAMTSTATSHQTLQQADPSRWPILIFPDEFRVRCLHGRHRVEAGRRFLMRGDRWWIVDFYRPDIGDELRSRLVRQNANEQPPDVGDIIFKILRCDSGDSRSLGFWYSQIQSPNEVAEIKRLLKRTRLAAAFRQVASVDGLGRGIMPGNIGKLLRLNCDEELAHYLSHVHDAMSTLLDGVPQAKQHLDTKTIRAIESRNVRHCQVDHDLLEPMVRRGEIFGQFRAEERTVVWANIQAFGHRIPSLATFFTDCNYLELVSSCVKTLFYVQRAATETLCQVLSQCFDRQVAEPSGSRSGHSPVDDQENDARRFDLARRRVFLFAMRYLEELRPGSVLLEDHDTKTAREVSRWHEHQFAQVAHRLGFRSADITTALAKNPDRVEAGQTLRRARQPAHFTYAETTFTHLVDQIVGIYAQARRVVRLREPPQYVTTTTDGEHGKHRGGKPFRRAFEATAGFMTLANMHPDNDDFGRGGLSALFIRRDVYLAFWGDIKLSAEDLDEWEEKDSDVVTKEHHKPAEDRPRATSSSPDRGSLWEEIRTVPIDAAAESTMVSLIQGLVRQQYHPFDTGFHALAVSQCVPAALHSEERRLFLLADELVREKSVEAVRDRSRKRAASEYIDEPPSKRHHAPRPRSPRDFT